MNYYQRKFVARGAVQKVSEMSQNENNANNNNNPTSPPSPTAAAGSKYVPWPVRKGIFRSIGQNDFVVPNRETSPIVEMPMSPSSARSSPARFVPGYNRSMSPRITIEESPLSPPPLVTSPPPVLVYPQFPPPPVAMTTTSATEGATHPIPTTNTRSPSPSPVVREVPIHQEPPPVPPLPSPSSLSEVIENP